MNESLLETDICRQNSSKERNFGNKFEIQDIFDIVRIQKWHKHIATFIDELIVLHDYQIL